jgi:hypothetical protein
MKKNRYFNTKGFMLVETLLVSLTIAGILIYMYAQFSSINDTYQRLYRYNTTEKLYHTDLIRQFMLNYTDGTESSIYGSAARKIVRNDSSIVSSKDYFNALFDEIDAKYIILTHDNLTPANKTAIISATNPEEKRAVEKYLELIVSTNESKKRLIIIYNDGSIATLLYDFEV